MEITPAILPKNFKEIEDKTDQILGLAKRVQIDICDGKYVPTITWPYWKSEQKVEENFDAILREERGMPGWEKLNFEFDLMIQNPTVEDLKKWIIAGAERIVIHYESTKILSELIDSVAGIVEVGVAVGNTTNVEVLREFSDKIQFIQIMGIRKAGFQGQKFEEVALEKIKQAKEIFPNLKVQVDGGVNIENAHLIKEAGADILVVGSAIFDGDDVGDIIAEFKTV